MRNYPTRWQKKTLWSAITALSIAALGALSVGAIWLSGKVIAFLQPLLIPVAVAAILAFLLEPVVDWFTQRRVPRKRAVILVFGVAISLLVALGIWLVPPLYTQSTRLGKKLPEYAAQARERITEFATRSAGKIKLPSWLTPHATKPKPTPTPSPTPEPNVDEPTQTAPADSPESPVATNPVLEEITLWLQHQMPTFTERTWNFLQKSVGGFLGAFGFLFSLVVVPLYLYYFLTESPKISERWHTYLPLRSSSFKDELVSALTEIHGYLISFFRGQLVVSLLNGCFTAIGLTIIGLDFGFVIGLLLCVVGVIPYLGIMMVLLPAVSIACVQNGSYLIPANPWWLLPVVTTGVIFLVQQIDALFITPRIVGDSVGLHPLTVILSIFGWGLLFGGLLGAIIAVPLTATLKVILQRYVWDRKLTPATEPPPDPKPVAPPPN